MRYLIIAILLAIGIGCVASDENSRGDSSNPNVEKATVVNNDFAIDLFKHVSIDAEGNVMLSPYSVLTSLVMTYAGADGVTKQEMEKVLQVDDAPEELHQNLNALTEHLKQKAGDIQLEVANKIWIQQNYEVGKEFLSTTEKYHDASIGTADFTKATEEARLAVNKWAEDQTNGKIKDLLPPGSVTNLTRLILANAVYFKGKWSTQFKTSATQKRDFYLSSVKKIETEMMRQSSSFAYAKNDELQIVEMPYEGDQLSMVLLLPNERDGIANLQEDLSGEKLQQWIDSMTKQELTVMLPKFKMNSDFSLAKTLADMGMPSAFDGKADFSKMSNEDELYISGVYHSTFVEVNEEGTEAAAATGVIMNKRAAPVSKLFNADHPFLFVIRDTETGCILFMGRLMNPEQ